MKKRHFIFSLALSVSAIAAVAQNLFTYKVGEYEVTLLSDGANKGRAELLIGATPEMIQETMPDSTYATAINYFLVKFAGKNYLIDTGLGKNIEANLYRAGVSPDEIHEIILTHLHGDHIGGLMKGGSKLFPNAVIRISEVEKAYWASDIEMALATDSRRKSFVPVRQTLQAYESQTELAAPGEAALPEGDGIFYLKAYGHTPGHMAVLFQSNGERLLVWGDLTHAMAIQMPYPEVALTYDVDPETAVQTRKKILEFVDAHGIPVVGMHVPYPAGGTVKSNSAGGYVFTPAE